MSELEMVKNKVRREHYLNEAKDLLASARRSEWFAHQDIQEMRKIVNTAGISFSELGTTEEELADLERESCRVIARSFLNRSKEKPEDVDESFGMVKDYLKKGGLTMEDISDRGFNIRALRRILVLARKQPSGAAEYVKAIKYGLEKHQLNLADIGTDDEEIGHLLATATGPR